MLEINIMQMLKTDIELDWRQPAWDREREADKIRPILLYGDWYTSAAWRRYTSAWRLIYICCVEAIYICVETDRVCFFVNRRIAEVGYICCVIHIAGGVEAWYCWYPFIYCCVLLFHGDHAIHQFTAWYCWALVILLCVGAVRWCLKIVHSYLYFPNTVCLLTVRWWIIAEDCSQLFIFSQYCLLAHSALVDHSRRLFTAIWYLWSVIFITKRICFCYYNKTVCWMIMKSCLISSLVKVKTGAHSS